MKQAFTMLELIFVIVVIGILSAVAVPRLAVTRDDALIAKARNTIASVRSAISTEHQKRILKGKFNNPITLVDSGNANNNGKPIFDHFDGNNTSNTVLEYPMSTCTAPGNVGCWIRTNATTYRYRFPDGDTADFNITNNKFICATTPMSSGCKRLTQ